MTKKYAQRIALGTAQFGGDYGIANQRGQVPAEEVGAILEQAGQQGIDTLDTARAYGNSEAVIGEILRKEKMTFRIVSKLASVPRGRDVAEFVAEQADLSISALGVDALDAYLVHTFSDLFEYKGLWPAMMTLKAKGMVGKVGLSLYRPEEIKKAWEAGISPDIVQVPYSVFDRRFEDVFPQMKEKGIEVHVRSVFLQGMALMKEEDVPEGLSAALVALKRLKEIAEEKCVSRQALCLHAVMQNEWIDRIVVGVDNMGQLKKNLSALCDPNLSGISAEELETLKISEEEILLPFLWKTKE